MTRGIEPPRHKGTKSLCLYVLVVSIVFSAGCTRPAPSTAAASAAVSQAAPVVEVVSVVQQKLDRTIRLPGELTPYQAVAVYPKVTGFVEWIGVDRGSRVKRGEPLARLSAPELVSQRAEAEARVRAIAAQRAEAQAKLVSDEGTFKRLKAAAATPGVVAGNDVDVAQKTVESDQARVQAIENSERAAEAAVRSVREIESYLQIAAPFDGVVTERNAHPGSLVSPTAAAPLVRIEQLARLRLTVAVPEVDVGGIVPASRVKFTVPAFPGETFEGLIQRVSHSLDQKTRTMPVELDVNNAAGRLAPGMFPEVSWLVRRAKPSLFVPPSAIVTTTERVFVIRVRDGKAEWVNVRRGAPSGDLLEVFGELRAGDPVVRRASDELRPGTAVTVRRPLD